MSFNFENYLLQELHSDKIIVSSEQLYVKDGEYDPNKIYVVTKYLTSDIEYGVETQPVQILVFSEENGMQEAKELFDAFAVSHNWRSGIYNGSFVKQQYSSPVVMSNFNEASYGFRSVLYISCTLYIMNNIEDVTNLKINGIAIKPLEFVWTYQMTGNTQPLSSQEIASTVKNISTFSASISIPVLNNYGIKTELEGSQASVDVEESYYSGVTLHAGYKIVAWIDVGEITSINQQNGTIYFSFTGQASTTLHWKYVSVTLLDDLMDIAAGQKTGNTTLTLTFSVYNTYFNYECKLISCHMISKPNDAPALQIGVQR